MSSSPSSSAAPPPSAFSHPDAAVLTHAPDLDDRLLSATASAQASSSSRAASINDLYDVQSTAEKLRKGGFKRVAMQFPDEGLPDSVGVFWALKRELQMDGGEAPEMYILADTSYGNCCVDEVAASHVSADVVVHYGHACLSPTARLPVIYVFPKLPLAPETNAQSIAEELCEKAREELRTDERKAEEGKTIRLAYDVGYAHIAGEVFERLNKLWQGEGDEQRPRLVMTQLDTRTNFEDKLAQQQQQQQGRETNGTVNGEAAAAAAPTRAGCCDGQGQQTCATPSAAACSSCLQPTLDSHLNPSDALDAPSLPTSDILLLYLGGESLALTNLVLRSGPSLPIISLDPFITPTHAQRIDFRSTNRLLSRRYLALSKARDASVVALLVGTLGVRSYLPLLKTLRDLLTSKGRKVYTVSVGKLNPAKLANFQEVEVFVLLACPENALLDAAGANVGAHGSSSRDFLRPIVTPWEMLLALRGEGAGAREWAKGDYVLGLERLRWEAEGQVNGRRRRGGQGGDEEDEDEDEDEEASDDDEEAPHFSLATGKYVSRRRFGGQDDEQPAEAIEDAGTGAVTVRSATSGQLTRVLESANAAHLSGRSWKGLEQRLGMDEPAVMEEGRGGVARGYEGEPGADEWGA